MNEVEKDFKSKGTVSRRVTVPLLFWEEWEQDCKENFNNTYHLKMMHDHQFRKQFNEVVRLVMADLADLREQFLEFKAALAQEEEKPQKTKTFG